VGALTHPLLMAGMMAWQSFWPLVLGFALSAVVQAQIYALTAFLLYAGT
jgi:hypothetical protein